MEDKLRRVDAPHVAALNALARGWRSDGRFVPWFDPAGAGTAARVLVLMESPGPRTVAAGDLGFSSEDNTDPTSAVLRAARVEAGLERSHYLRWNVVPWPLHDADGRRRAPTTADLDAARPALRAVLAACPDLAVVVTVGTPALTGVMRHLTLGTEENAGPGPLPRLLPVLAVPHPSPRNGYHRAEARTRLTNALRQARLHLEAGPACGA
ncbi:uracil-DNA glycosylase [Nocardioides sp. ChNu-153]|uniref:uracil-DNA glycosylase n=1 Tax=unclassified Nocardioides TaxID=2615069 RepID=UPI0024077677|nr:MULTISPECIES: uracil-DNA glycosylase [unclassified Nocardioides]MDF9714655.1 uracil-DNA glycosylase [Nocardioides sp. ChNu-99]MDN7119810.1 uracil-DNA glycosylase [Nocardioides sp. ChNu-153]